MLKYRTAGYSGYAVQYSPFFDSKIAVASAANFGLVGNGRLHILDIGNDGMVRPQVHFDTQDGLFSVAWSEQHENHVATANGDGSIKLFDITAAQFPIKLYHEHTKEVFGINWNLVDKNLFCSSSWDGTIKVWNPAAPTNGSVMTINAPPITPPKLASVPVIKQQQQPQTGDTNCIYTAKFSPHNASTLASAHADSTVRIYDTRTQQPAIINQAHSGVECLTLDWNKYKPTTLVSAGVDKAVKVWDIRKLNSPVNDLRGHDYAVRSVSWSPHSPDVLLSTSYDTTARVWRDQSASGTAFIPRMNHSKGLMSIFDKHSEFVIGSDWSLWGQPGWVATVGWDEMLYIWKAD